jgi:RES domain-containing protein
VILWRLSTHLELDGAGGLRAPGRWHSEGRPIVYCSPNPAASLVETLVHMEIDSEDLPDVLQYLEIEAPDGISLEKIDVGALGRNWQTNPEVTRRAGDEWLRAARTALLRVPSVVVPATWNTLMNPRHADSRRVRVVRVHRHGMDRRLAR